MCVKPCPTTWLFAFICLHLPKTLLSMDSKIKVFLADDHQVLIDGMKIVLNAHKNYDVVGFASNGDGLIDKVCEKNAEILIMDINMPEKDGIEVLKEFQERGYCCKVIVLSSYDDITLIKEVLRLGAKGYLSKDCAGENIIEAIETVYQGKDYYSQNISRKIFDSFSGRETLQESDKIIMQLSDRELEVLKLIVEEYSNKEISDALCISMSTVETHRKNLIKKLNVKNTIGLVKYAIKNKLVE